MRAREVGILAVLTVAMIHAKTNKLNAQVAPASTTPNGATANPIAPEKQPRLDIDRDPVPSPDPDQPAPDLTSFADKSPQAKEVQKGQDGYTLRTDVDEVLLSCTVIDDKGRIVTDLTQRNFQVWEDGKPQRIISAVRQDVPVSMGILVDNSGSMRDKRSAVNAAMVNLLKASNRQDAAFIVNFSDRAFLDQGFTSDLVALTRGLSRLDSRGTTALYDAVAASADELAKHANERKQALLIITDGADNASRLTLAQAIRRVQNLGGPVVYAIGLSFGKDGEESEKERNDLSMLAQETGGLAYFPTSLDDLNNIAEQVARDIRDQYTIDYRTAKPTTLGGYRSVHVEASAPGHGKLTVRTKRGYYARIRESAEVSQATKQD